MVSTDALSSILFEEERAVSTTWLAHRFKVPIKEAQQSLADFVQSHAAELAVTWLIIGSTEKGFRLETATDKELSAASSKFKEITSCNPLSACSITKALICPPILLDDTERDLSLSAIIPQPTTKVTDKPVRVRVVEHIELPSTLPSVPVKAPAKPPAKPSTSSSSSSPPPPGTKKSNALASMFSAQTAKAKAEPDAVEPDIVSSDDKSSSSQSPPPAKSSPPIKSSSSSSTSSKKPPAKSKSTKRKASNPSVSETSKKAKVDQISLSESESEEEPEPEEQPSVDLDMDVEIEPDHHYADMIDDDDDNPSSIRNFMSAAPAAPETKTRMEKRHFVDERGFMRTEFVAIKEDPVPESPPAAAKPAKLEQAPKPKAKPAKAAKATKSKAKEKDADEGVVKAKPARASKAKAKEKDEESKAEAKPKSAKAEGKASILSFFKPAG